MAAASSVPTSVALGMVRSGSRILPAGIVAHSRPRNAQSVSVAVAVMLAATLPAVVSVTVKWDGSNSASPPMPTTASGRTFRTVVTSCTRPAAPTPQTLTPVSSQTVAIAAPAASAGVRTMVGMKGSR
jgi:hypothetical protein